MKQTTKVLLSAVLTIALCVSVISGATFALFTSEAKTNIAVTAGTVEVNATISDLVLTTSLDATYTSNDKFQNNGTATIDGGTLTLKNVTPGDIANFNIVITNTSNVSIKYRVAMQAEGPLAEVLEMTANAETITTEAKHTEWSDAVEAQGTIPTIAVKVELPAKVNDDYQGGDNVDPTNVTIRLEAVQANGTELYGAQFVGDAKDFGTAIDAVADGGTVVITENLTFNESSVTKLNGYYEGYYYEGDKSFTIDLNGQTITNDSAVNDYLFLFKNTGAKENTITFKNGTIEAASSAFSAICTSSTSKQKITINLEDVKVIGNNTYGSVVKVRGGTELNVNAGTVITGNDSYLGIECNNSIVNIYDGAEIYQNGTSSYNGCLVGVGGSGTVNVYGGYGKGVAGGFIAMTSGGTINVEGGEWIADTDNTFSGNDGVLIAQSQNGAKSVVDVTGGTFKGGYNCYGDAIGDAKITISAGTYNTDPSAYVATGYKAVAANGVYVVVPEATEKVSSAADLTDALANGNDIVIDGTIDLGGKSGASLNIANDITITGGTIKGTGWAGEQNYGVNATAGNIVFDGVTFDTTDWTTEGWANWGISANVHGTANVTFKNCTFVGSQCPIYQSGADSVITLENCKFSTTSVAIQCEIYSGDFSLGQDLIVKNCDFTGVADVLHIYDYDKDPSSEAIAQYLTDNGNTFTGVCKQTCK